MNFRIAHRRILLWLLAVLITLGSAVYQRRTGPTYPVRGELTLEGRVISYKLLRSETVNRDAPIILDVPDTAISGYIAYRRYKSHDDWTSIPLRREGDELAGYLPHQPPAGKLMYFVYLEGGDERVSLTGAQPVILRYKGAVPSAVLAAHVLLMLLAMTLSNRTALEALDKRGSAYKYMLWTLGVLFIGGLIMGPVVQKYAFGAFWTGVPFGYDLTDNKTLIAMLGWVWAWTRNRKGKDGRGWIVFAGILMLVIYLVPHSLLGSELDYTKLPDASQTN